MSLALRLEWHARDIHPWDSDLPDDRRAELFTAAFLAGTVCRDDLSAAQACPSPAMGLKLLGIQYRLAD
jgi:hypothetical protein